MSREERPQPITSGTCIAHKSTTSGGMASGTSGHKYNMNPHSGEQLTKLHSHIVKINRSGTRKAILKDVRKEEKRTEFTSVQPSVVTCWSSSHDECVRANQNQYDLNETINRLISEHGLDKDIFEEHMDTYGNLNNAIILSENWDFFQQYEGGMQPLRDMITWCQSAQVIVHEELFECRRVMELLSVPYFEMHDNISRKRGVEHVTDLTQRPCNQIVVLSNFRLCGTGATKFIGHHKHKMINEVAIARRVAFRQMGVRFGMFIDEKCPSLPARNETDPDITENILYGLEDADELPEYMIMGAIMNPLMQNSKRLVAAGL